jgi:hypothetical protein
LEIRVNLFLIALLGLLWLGLRVHSPEPVMARAELEQLAPLEDAYADDPADAMGLVRLTQAYLDVGHAALAVAVLRAAEPALLEEPVLAHQLARAYEQSGRLLDALATVDLALARCSRVLGAKPLETAVPTFSCSERTYATLDTHKGALERMVKWGVVDPRVDPRAQRAYEMAQRRARIAMDEAAPSVPVP